MSVIAQGLDYSARRLTGEQVRDAGYTFVNRYLWFPGQRWPALTDVEYRDMVANGVEVHAIYEQNTNDPAGGFDAGVRMARQAVESARACGLPRGTTIFMCADAWLATHGIPVSTAMAFLDGARSVIDPAGYMLGAYGFADFIYAAQDGGHADRFWLCGAESGVRNGIHMYQWNNGRVYVDGLECDLNKQYLPMRAGGPGGGGGGDEMSWDTPIENHYGSKPPAKVVLAHIDQATNDANDKLDALIALVGELAKDPALTPERAAEIMRDAVSTANDAALAKQQVQLDATLAVVREVIGERDENLADEVVEALGQRLSAQPDGDA